METYDICVCASGKFELCLVRYTYCFCSISLFRVFLHGPSLHPLASVTLNWLQLATAHKVAVLHSVWTTLCGLCSLLFACTMTFSGWEIYNPQRWAKSIFVLDRTRRQFERCPPLWYSFSSLWSGEVLAMQLYWRCPRFRFRCTATFKFRWQQYKPVAWPAGSRQII